MRKQSRVSRKLKGPLRFNAYQTFSDRIRWLRAKQKPYMTQKQLSFIARVPLKTISLVESRENLAINLQLDTIRRIGHALGCTVFIQLKSKPSRAEGECQLLGPELPPPPKRTGKTSGADRARAVLNGRSPYKNYRRKPRLSPRKEISEIAGSEPSPLAGKPE